MKLLTGFYRFEIIQEGKTIGTVVAKSEESARSKALFQFWRIRPGHRGLYPSFQVKRVADLAKKDR